MILRLFDELLDTAPTLGAALEWKSSLQELTASRGLGVPRYDVTSEGPDHDRRFSAVVYVNGEPTASGLGRSKKAAETDAAAQAWTALDAEPVRAGDDPADDACRRRRTGCLNFPRSRWCGAACRRTSRARPSPRSGCTIPRAVRRHEAGAADLTARLLGARITGTDRRGKYLWLTSTTTTRRWWCTWG